VRPSLVILAAVLAGSAPAIIRRADRPDARYLELGARHPSVIALGRVGDATLIAPQWLLTAAHVARAVRNGRAGPTVTIAGRQYPIDKVILHPAWQEMSEHDVGLVHLARPVIGVSPLPLYRGESERGMIATIVGHGSAGTGDSRDRAEDGRARGATSRVDSVSDAWLFFSFDAPPAGTDLEGAPGRGDSGGPAIIEIAGRFAVAGISSAGYDGRDGPGSYGAIDVFTRVSTHAAWIDSVMNAPAGPP
jgi:hypothetical protein